jgi:hypothetical protein
MVRAFPPDLSSFDPSHSEFDFDSAAGHAVE